MVTLYGHKSTVTRSECQWEPYIIMHLCDTRMTRHENVTILEDSATTLAPGKPHKRQNIKKTGSLNLSFLQAFAGHSLI